MKYLIITSIFLFSLITLTGCQKQSQPPTVEYSSDGNSATIDTSELYNVPDYRIKGDKNAPVTLVEFADFQCPACADMPPLLDKIFEKYNGKVRIIFRHFPLPYHENATIAALAAETAGKQGKFWDMFEIIYKNQSQISRDNLIGWAGTLGLDKGQFTKDLDDPSLKTIVENDVNYGEKIGVDATPTLFVNGEKVDNISENNISNIIDKILK